MDRKLEERPRAAKDVASRDICLRAGDRAKILGPVGDNPRVSVCIPAYRAESHIGETLESVLAQTEPDFEVVVIDDASGDGTLEIVRGLRDERIRTESNPRNLGQAATTNRAITLSRGRLVKIVHSDDRIDPRCLEVMADALERHPSAGLAFAPRRVEIEPGAGRPALWWANANRAPHAGFGELSELNPGGELFDRWLRDGFLSNWIGEPTNVLLRRSALERVGLTSPRVLGAIDMDLWARVLRVSDAVFVDEPLSTYRTGGASLTSGLRATDADWLQRLWSCEGLIAVTPDSWQLRWLLALRRNERLEAAKESLRIGLRGPAGARRVARDVAAYAAYALRARLGRAPAMSPPLAPL